MISRKLGNYRITDKLGEGGQGTVYKCVDERLGRHVAIKILPSELTINANNVKRFEREARLASALEHPNICIIFDLQKVDDQHFIAMQYVEGTNLKELIGGRPLELDAALSIGIQITDALAFAHSRGIIHRDIKALNVMVTKDGQVKILDFGLAKLSIADDLAIGAGSHETDMTQLGVAYGTPAYSAPEQSRGERVDNRADIFSTGVLLFEMITGAKPFQGKTSDAIRYAVINDLPRRVAEVLPRRVPARLQQILDRALAKDPRDRYQRVDELRDDLRQLLTQIKSGTRVELAGGTRDEVAQTPARQLGDSNPVSRALRWFRRISDVRSSRTQPEAVLTTDEARFTTATDDEKKSIAILPFKNLSNDSDSSFYEFSLADALITELARVRSLVVRPSSVIAKYHGRSIDPREAGRELSVSAVLSAGFLRAGDRIRVTAQLVDVNSGGLLWSDRIDADATDIINVQDTITQEICAGLRLELSPAEQAGLQQPATVNAEAYEEYLRGRDSLGRYIYQTLARADIDAAIEHFKRATDHDPGFALAYGGLGAGYANRVLKGYGEPSDYNNAEEILAKALDLDPHLLEARVLMVFIHLSRGEKKSASSLAKKLRQEHPNEVSVYYLKSTIERLNGDYMRSMRNLDRMERLNPAEQVIVSYNRARLHTYQGNYDEALAQLDAAAAVEPDHPLVKVFRAYALYYAGETDAAVQILERLFQGYPQLVGVRPIYAILLFAVGRRADAYSQLTDEVKELAQSDYDIAEWLASAYALAGDRDNAFYWLTRAIELGNENKLWFETDRNWAAIRDDPRFSQIMDSITTSTTD